MGTPVYYVMLIILHIFMASGLLAVWLLCLGLLFSMKSTLEKKHGLKMIVGVQRCVLTGFLPLSFLMLLTGFLLLDIQTVSFSLDWVVGSLLAFVLMWLCAGVTFFLSLRAQIGLEAEQVLVPESSLLIARLIFFMRVWWVGLGVPFIAMLFLMVGH